MFLVVQLGAAPVQLAQPPIQGVNVAPAALAFFGEHLADRLRSAGFTVITQREIGTLLGVERQRALLGCEQNSSCVAELASALGADGVVAGDVGHFGDVYQVNLKVLSGANAAVLGSFSERVGSKQQVLDALERGARALSTQTHTSLGRPVPGPIEGNHASARSLAWVPAVGGGALAVAGGVLFGLAFSDYSALTTSGPVITDGPGVAAAGKLKYWLGIGGLALGGAALVTSLLMAVLGGSEAKVSLAPVASEHGAGVAISGVFP